MTKFVLLASSLSPALWVVAIRLFENHPPASVAVFAVSIFLISMLAKAVRARDTTNAIPLTLAQVKDESEQVPAYLATYIFPVVFLSAGTKADLAACVVFVMVILVLMYRTDLALVNPLLLAVGFHMYRARSTGGVELTLLSNRRPTVGQTVTAVRLAANTYKLRSIED